MSFVNRMNQHVAKNRIGIRMKKPRGSPSVWMVDAVLQGVWVLHRINNEDDQSLPLLACRRDVVNAIFLKYSKEDSFTSSHERIWNILLEVFYNDTKQYQVQSEKRCAKNPKKTVDAARLNVNQTMMLANVSLRKVRFENLWISSV